MGVGSGYIQDGSDAVITAVTSRSFHPEPVELGNESSAELEAPVQLPAQTSGSSTESPELSHLFRRKFHSSCQREHRGIGTFALGELRRCGITDGSQHCAVRARMFRQQAKEPVVFHRAQGAGDVWRTSQVLTVLAGRSG